LLHLSISTYLKGLGVMTNCNSSFLTDLPQQCGVRFALLPCNHAYAIGSDGSVWSRWKINSAGRGKPLPRTVGQRWKKLNPSLDAVGRRVVNIADGVKIKQQKVHRLVLLAFVGPCPIGMIACHNNGDHSDNRLENLRWDTHKSNSADTLIHGTHNRGERCGTSKMKANDVIDAVSRYRGGESSKLIASDYGVTANHIARLARGERWPELACELAAAAQSH
jgi:hypothetical protein